jgi:hypothetical protein
MRTKQRRQQTVQRRQQMIVVAQWGNLNRWTYLHQVALLLSLAERTNHGREPLLSISTSCVTLQHFVKHRTIQYDLISPPIPYVGYICTAYKLNKLSSTEYFMFYIYSPKG